MPPLPVRDVPGELAALRELALDLRWTWSHEADALWERVDATAWQSTGNPWMILQHLSSARLNELVADRSFVKDLEELAAACRAYLGRPGWFASTHDANSLRGVAYFSMEFGLSEALPLYAGGLGVLAGDFLKTASDLGVPVSGVGLLYQEGYFRQMLDAAGWQHEVYSYNDPLTMPIQPVIGPDGAWLRISIALPGRTLSLRVWQAAVGRSLLYLLDSNDALNSPIDQGITRKLYASGTELRLLQEIALGIGGWRVIEALRPEVEICHLNEGHAAFAAIERARAFARRSGLNFRDALWATRAGNIFTTHTAVAAGFDHYPRELVDKYLSAFNDGPQVQVVLADLLALGCADGGRRDDSLNMAYLAARASLSSFGVSRLHGRESRRVFQPLFAHWPEHEVPIDHVTNGVHMPSWDSAHADRLWTDACGKDRWLSMPDALCGLVEAQPDEALWALRDEGSKELVRHVRRRLTRQLAGRGEPAAQVAEADTVLDANILTLGFARRFTAYKRPNLLLRDPARLERLLTDRLHPVQLVIAGKAHPDDVEGKRMIQEWLAFARRPEFRHSVVFLEDYDIALAQELVQGVDVWLNTPRRPWEACGTSGMKVLVNGGLNLSVLDGWWDEAYAPDLGWAIGGDGDPTAQDSRDAEALYATLERDVVPQFYARDSGGIPRAWVARLRHSMAVLTPAYSSARMMSDYLTRAYLPAAAALRARLADDARPVKRLGSWERSLRRHWRTLRIGETRAVQTGNSWQFSVPIWFGKVDPDHVGVEVFAGAHNDTTPEAAALKRAAPLRDEVNAYIYEGCVPSARAAEDFTVRIVPRCSGVRVPTELSLISWQR